MAILKSIDMFGRNNNLVIEGNTQFKTVFGGIMTIGVLIFTTIFVILTGKNFYQRTNALIVVEETYSSTRIEQSLTTENFPFIIKIIGQRKKFTNDEIPLHIVLETYEIKVVDGKREKATTRTKMVNCDLLKGRNIPIIDAVETNGGFFCLDSEVVEKALGEPFTIYQDPRDNSLRKLKIYITGCFDKKCASEKEISDFFQIPVKAVVITPDNFFQSDSPTDLIGSSTFQTNFQLNRNLFKSKSYEYESFKVINDKGYMFEEIETQQSIYLKGSLSDVTFKDVSSTDYATIEVVLTPKIKSIKRTYEKLQTVMANTGGVVKVLLLFVQLIMSFVVNRLFDLDLIRKLKIKPQEIIKFKVKDTSSVQINPAVKEEVKLTLFGSITGFFKPSSKVYRSYRLAKKELDNKIDFINLVRKVSLFEQRESD